VSATGAKGRKGNDAGSISGSVKSDGSGDGAEDGEAGVEEGAGARTGAGELKAGAAVGASAASDGVRCAGDGEAGAFGTSHALIIITRIESTVTAATRTLFRGLI
jgi:hypothetical protein